ncbi:hypothetical protein FNH22_30935 [Fulvivirga sp. M361]|uniref:hypothetical protein n=1 Tax=Fulvivirga sp. M361 TaxID=2594266 RepID=UPI00117BBF4A|nr:hypothetical protein [Fulvivirga sp. M361]TRX46410.1 hypothetical protein FNH22_30935 [Fulvivirga sp. M361]
MRRIPWDLNIWSAIILFMVIHMIVGGIRGIYRYQMIKKYQYDYYDNHPLRLMGRIRHNLFYGTFTTTTFYISATLTAMTVFALLAFTQS